MKDALLRCFLIVTMSVCAPFVHAQQVTPGFHFVLNGGLTFGGDTIDTVQYSGGNSIDIKAGGLVQLGGGALWQFQSVPAVLQLTANYHVDDATASNGSAKFDRFPLEASLFYTGIDKWRFGAGVRFNQSPKYTYHVDGGQSASIDFKNSTGVLLEAGYGFTPHTWMNVRLVSEKYQAETYTINGTTYNGNSMSSFDGSHIGIAFMYVF